MVQGDRNENVFLTPSTTCQREKQVSHWTSLKSTYDSTDIDHIYGTFKLSTTSLSGNYRYEHAAGAEGRSVLSLQWIQPQPQLHVLISDVAVNPDDDSSSDDDDDTNKFRDLNNPFSALEDNIGTGAHSSFSITFKEVGISTQETSLRLDLSCAYSASLESEDSVEIDSTLGNLATTTQTINTHSELKSTTLSDLASTFERNEEKARYFLRLPETLHSILGFPCALEVQQHGYLDSSRLWLYSTFSHAYSAKTLVQDSIPSLNATVSVGTSLNHIHFSGAELEEGELDEVENQEPSVHVPAAVAESEGKPETIKQVEINGRQVSLPSCPLSICGLDCEMCVTDAGLELTRITVVCPHRGVILDELVRPARTIINYNTAFSGITEETLTGVTATLKDIQKLLAWFINVNTLVVGHSLDSDLHALKLAHSCVCDTSALYPHHKVGFC